jgi:CRISPR-associated protein (TIGR02710 family)
MPQAMIVSLGGSPEPLIKTLSEQRPQVVCFFASQESVDLVGKVKESVVNAGISFRDYKVLVEDINDLAHCYQKALACADWITNQGVSAEEVIVDYTGGTKTMTAALVLATIRRGFRFSYVGGSRRTKGGLGVVESGSEEVRLGPNPWELFAVQERQRLAQYFNSYQFVACRTLIQGVADRLSPDERQRFDVLDIVVEGYEAWDRFNHKHGLNRLEKGLVELRKLVSLHAEGFLASVTNDLTGNVEFLRRLKENTRDFQELHHSLLSDLLANARRRIEEGKFDDAAARLYRLVEMIGQIEVRHVCGAKTGDFPPEQIPEPLREEFVRRYRDEKDNMVKLPLEATYQVLQEQGNEIGRHFLQERGRFSNLQRARNQSILAHGVTPIEEKWVRELLDFVSALVPLQDEPRFPKLSVE